MGALGASYNINNQFNPDADKMVNVPPLHTVSGDLTAGENPNPLLAWKTLARLPWPAGEVVPADGDCSFERVYGGEGAIDGNNDGDVAGDPDPDGGGPLHADQRFQTKMVDTNDDGVDDLNVQVGAVAPDGSGAGRNASLDFATNPLGCADGNRSSSAPSDAQKPNFDTWAFALDGLGWNYFPGNTHGVTSLTKTDLGNVYTCSTTNVDVNGNLNTHEVGDRTAGEPIDRYWGDLSGNTADSTPIKAYRIQPGSGTGDDVANLLMGITNNTHVGDNCSTMPKDLNYPTVEEHDCRGVSDVDKPDAICFYGYSRWRIQARNIEPDKRNGAKFGAFTAGVGTPLLPSASTIREGAGRYDATRYVFSLIVKKNLGPDLLPGYRDMEDFIGVRPTNGVDVNGDGDVLDTATANPDIGTSVSAVPGFVCSAGVAQKIIRTFGLVPLKLATTDGADTHYGSSYCRHNTYAVS